MLSLCSCLGVSIFPTDPNSLHCTFGQVLDKFGDHLLSCGHGNGQIRLHDALCEVIFYTLLQDNPNTCREQCSGMDSNKPGDVYHPDFTKGLLSYFDISVRNPMQPTHIAKASCRTGVAAGGVFYPLIVECFGCWSPSSLQMLKNIARKSSLSTTTTLSKAVTNLHQ